MGLSVVAVSSEASFLHLIQALFESVGWAVQTTSDWRSAPSLVEGRQPRLVILDLRPWEDSCWSALEAMKGLDTTRAIPVLVCPVASRLLAGHEKLLALDGVHVWPEGFQLQDLLKTVDIALAAPVM